MEGHTAFVTDTPQQLLFNTTLLNTFNNVSLTLREVKGQGDQSGFLSVEVYDVLVLLFGRVMLPLTEIFGMITNTINILVFWSMGLNDSMTSSFFALSLADFFYLAASFICWSTPIYEALGAQTWLRLADLAYICVWYSHMFLAVSVLLTTYIAIQRCCCVAMPLKFKGVFTAGLNYLIIAIICITSAALHIPILSKMGLKSYLNPSTNTSMVALWFADDWNSLLTIKDVLVGLWLPITTQVVTIICMGILISGLRASSKFRQLAASAETGKSSDTKGTVKVNTKEIQVVKAVLFVTLLFIVCNMAPICQAIARRSEKGFARNNIFGRVFYVVVIMKHFFQHLNASFNILIYLKFNSTYRNTLRTLMKRKIEI